MTLVLNPNLIVYIILSLMAFANPRSIPFTPAQTQPICAQIGSLGVDAQTRSLMTVTCAGSDLARVQIANHLRNGQFVFTAEPAVDGRYNVYVDYEIGRKAEESTPKCDFGENYNFYLYLEGPGLPSPLGMFMEKKAKCLLSVISADAMWERVEKYARSIGESLDDAPWDRAMELYKIVCKEIADRLFRGLGIFY
jgi:hypothetical protein